MAYDAASEADSASGGGRMPAERLIHLLLDSVREPVVVLGHDRRILHVSTSAAEWFGSSVVELVGHDLLEAAGARLDVPEVRRLLVDVEALDADGRTADFLIAPEQGRQTSVRVRAKHAADLQCTVLTIEDDTERITSARELAASRERFELLVENVREYAIFATDVRGSITLWNPGAKRILGWSETEILGGNSSVIFTEEDRAEGIPEAELETAASNGQAIDERWHVRKDGSRFWASGVMIALKRGDVVEGYVKILRDNTRRKRAETEIESSRRWLRRILEATPDVVALYDLQADRLGFVSPHLISNLGYEQAEFFTLDREAIGRILHPDDRARAAVIRQAVQQGGEQLPREITVRAINSTGEVRWYHARLAPFGRDAEGKIREVLIVARDFTEMHEAQQQLQQMTETLEKRVEERTAQARALASTLTMAEQQERRRISQILHDDLQQRLYGIQMKMAAVRRGAEGSGIDRLQRDAREAEGWLRDAIELTRDLTVELSPPVLKGEGIVEVLHWLVAQMDRMYGLQVTVHAPQPSVIPDEDMRVLLFQIVRELLFNVVKHAGVDRATVELAEEEEQIVIRVSDRGRGFDLKEADKHRISDEPFGLFSVQERLRLFGGEVRIQTSPGAGTTVEIRAPRALRLGRADQSEA